MKFVVCAIPPITSQFQAAALAKFVVVSLKTLLIVLLALSIRKVPDI